jgi:hypothetical protein
MRSTSTFGVIVTLTLFVILSFDSITVDCMINHKVIRFDKGRIWNAVSIDADGFGFLKNGYLSLNISAPPIAHQARLVFSMVRADVWNLLSAAKWDSASKYASFFCELPSFARFPVSGDLDIKSVTTNPLLNSTDYEQQGDIFIQRKYTVPESGHYALLLLKCEPNLPTDTFEVKIDAILLNPNGQHLSTQTVPLILVFYVLTTLYALLSLYWIFLCIRNLKSFTRLHLVITASFLSQIAAMGGAYLYYQLMSKYGELSSSIEITIEILSAIADTLFLLVLLLVAMAWTLTENQVVRRVQNTFSLAFFLYFLFRVLYAFCRQPSLCPAYILSFRVIKFLLTFGIIIAMNQSIEKLRIQSLEQQFAGNTGEVFIKMKMLKIYRLSFFFYLAAPLFIILLQYAFVSWVNYWVLIAVEQLINYFIQYIICTTFYPKKFNLAENDNDIPAPTQLNTSIQ